MELKSAAMNNIVRKCRVRLDGASISEVKAIQKLSSAFI